MASGVFFLIEGIVSVLASKNNKYGTSAFIFAILGVVSNWGNIESMSNGGSTASGIGSIVVSCIISALIIMASMTVRKAYKEEKKQ